MAEKLSEPLPTIIQKSMRPGLVLGKCSLFRKRKDEILEIMYQLA